MESVAYSASCHPIDGVSCVWSVGKTIQQFLLLGVYDVRVVYALCANEVCWQDKKLQRLLGDCQKEFQGGNLSTEKLGALSSVLQ